MCSKEASIRIAISHMIIFSLLTYVFITLSLTLTKEQDPNYRVDRRAFFVISGCFAYPLVFSLVLLYGVLRQNLTFIRTWLISTTLLSILLLFLLLSGAIYVTLSLEVYWGVILCAMPFVLNLWMAEGLIVVFSYYKKEEKKNKEANPA